MCLYPKLILNPTTKDHWIFHEFFEKKGLEGGENCVIDNVMYIHTSYKDVNREFIPKNIIRDYGKLKIENPSKYNNIVEGGWVQDPEGILIPKNTIKFRNMSEIDIKDVVFTLAVGDPADTGGDKYSMPFIWCVQIDGELSFWIKDWIHNTDGIEANNERILLKLKEHLIEQIFIESNGIGLASVYGLKNKLNEHQKLTGFPSKISKDVRILSNYEFVQKYFIFDSDYEAKQEYKQAISDVCGYVKDGENKHKKDGLDVLCLAASILKIKFRSVFYG